VRFLRIVADAVMAELIGVVSKAVGSYFELQQVSIDNWSFKLFYKITTSILVLSSVLVTARQFFGDPIKCDAGIAEGVEGDVLNSYCWMYSSWNIPADYKGACSAGTDYRNTGEGELSADKWNQNSSSIVYNSYYQWVPLYLILLAFLVYLPRMFWLIMEGGLMEFFGKGTTTRHVEDQDEKKEELVKFFCKNVHNKYNIYFFGFMLMEFLNWMIIVILFFVTDAFLNYKFSWYGTRVWRYYRLPIEVQRETANPMCDAFPRIASCDYWRWGAGGKQENINAICVLNLNMINDKVFMILWWWFFFLVIIGFIRIIYRIIQTQSAKLRFQLLNMRMNRYFKRSSKVEKIEYYVSKCKLGDWFVLYQLSKNLNRPFFMDFLTHLSVRYTKGHVCSGVEDPDDSEDGLLLGQMNSLLRPSKCKQECEEEKGDNMLEMITQPKLALDEPDGKKDKDKKEGSEEDDDDEESEEEEEKKEKTRKKSSGKGGVEERPDLPDGSPIIASRDKADKKAAKTQGSCKSKKK